MDKIGKMIEQVLAEPYRPLPKNFTSNEGMLAHLSEYVKFAYLQEPKVAELQPMFVVATENGQIVPMVTPFVGPDELIEQVKETIAVGVAGAMALMKARRYAFISEAWVASFKSVKEADQQRAGRQIKDLENKKEVIQLIVSDENETIGNAFELVRDWETGEIIELKPFAEYEEAEGETAKFSGRFSDLLS